MKTFLNSLSILILLISKINLQLTDEEKQKLYNKVTIKIGFGEIRGKNKPLNSFYVRSKISYEPSKIKDIIDKNKFPQSYNFIDEEKPDVHIKDQENCGVCWSFASTTALAYRFHKKGIKINLSPQYPASCYIRDCLVGDYLINSQFNLAKNGTVTEECLPYSSARGIIIDDCPTSCKDGSQFQLYYSKNSYSTIDDYDQENYYDIVTVIMDQLINYGPVVSSIDCYSDFQSLKGGESCYQTIYNYDGVSPRVGGHAIVIVGYGYENSKYYWIIQNSWGEDFCNGGFAKVEFAQIGIEKVGFSEPYIPDNSTEKEISVKFTPSEDCKLRFNSNSSDIENSFEMKFKNIKSSDSNFYYQCGLEPLKNSNEGICSYDANSIYNEKGYYTYSDYLSLQKKNLFQFDFSSLQNQQFYYYGADYIDPFYGKDYYISEEGSKIFLYFQALSDEDDNFVSLIYPNKERTTPLSNCKSIRLDYIDISSIVYCDLTKSEINYFDSSLPLAYSVLCGRKEPTSAMIHKLDKSNYPLYRVKRLVIPDGQYLQQYSEFIMIADIEGSISGIDNNNHNTFGAIIDIKNDEESNIKFLHCETPEISSKKTNIKLTCIILLDNSDLGKFKCSTNNVYLYPMFYPKTTYNPYEVRINDKVEYSSESSYDPSSIPTDSSIIPTDYSIIKTDSLSIQTDSLNIPIDSSNLSIDFSSITIDSSIIQTDSLNIPIDSSIITIDSSSIPTDSLNIPIDSSNLSIDSSIISTDSSSIPTDSLNITIDSSNLAIDSSSIAIDSSNLSTDSSSISTESTKLSTDSLNISTDGISADSSSIMTDRISTDSSIQTTEILYKPIDSSSAYMDSLNMPSDTTNISKDNSVTDSINMSADRTNVLSNSLIIPSNTSNVSIDKEKESDDISNMPTNILNESSDIQPTLPNEASTSEPTSNLDTTEYSSSESINSSSHEINSTNISKYILVGFDSYYRPPQRNIIIFFIYFRRIIGIFPRFVFFPIRIFYLRRLMGLRDLAYVEQNITCTRRSKEIEDNMYFICSLPTNENQNISKITVVDNFIFNETESETILSSLAKKAIDNIQDQTGDKFQSFLIVLENSVLEENHKTYFKVSGDATKAINDKKITLFLDENDISCERSNKGNNKYEFVCTSNSPVKAHLNGAIGETSGKPILVIMKEGFEDDLVDIISTKNLLNKHSSSTGLNLGAITGIVLACLIAVAAVAIIIVLCNKNPKPVAQASALELYHSTSSDL